MILPASRPMWKALITKHSGQGLRRQRCLVRRVGRVSRLLKAAGRQSFLANGSRWIEVGIKEVVLNPSWDEGCDLDANLDFVPNYKVFFFFLPFFSLNIEAVTVLHSQVAHYTASRVTERWENETRLRVWLPPLIRGLPLSAATGTIPNVAGVEEGQFSQK